MSQPSMISLRTRVRAARRPLPRYLKWRRAPPRMAAASCAPKCEKPCGTAVSEVFSEDYLRHRAFLYNEEAEMAKGGKYESSKSDKKADKKSGKEDSPSDKKEDAKGAARFGKGGKK